MGYICDCISNHHLGTPHDFFFVPLYLLKEENKSLQNDTDMLSVDQTSLDFKSRISAYSFLLLLSQMFIAQNQRSSMIDIYYPQHIRGDIHAEQHWLVYIYFLIL